MRKPETEEREIEGTQTFVNDALESYKRNALAIIEPELPELEADIFCTWQTGLWCQDCKRLRITLNSRLAIAAAAIVQRIIIRRRPRVLRPLSPFRKGSNPAATIVDAVDELDGCRQGRSQKV